MAQSTKAKGSLHCQLQLKSSAEKLYGVFQNKLDLFTRIMPQDIWKVEMISTGVWLWTFIDDTCGSWNFDVEPLLDNNGTDFSVEWTLLEGKVLQQFYTSLKVDFKFKQTDKDCDAEATLIYEKKSDCAAHDPHEYLDFICEMLEAAGNFFAK